MQPFTLLLSVLITLTSSAGFSSPLESAQQGAIANNLSTQAKFGTPSKRSELNKLKEKMASLNIPAVSIAFMEDHNISWTLAEGVIDFVSKRDVTENTLFQTANIAQPVLNTVQPKYSQEQDVIADSDVTVESWPLPMHKWSPTSAVNLRRLLNHPVGTTGHIFGAYAAEKGLAVVAALKGTSLTNSKVILKSVSTEHKVYSQAISEQLATNAAIPHRAIGLPVEGGEYTAASRARAGLWTTPSKLLMLASNVQTKHQGINRSLISHKPTAQNLNPQIASMGIGTFFEKHNGSVTSFSDGGVNDGFSTHLFIHAPSGDGVAIMTNSENGIRLINDILSSISEVYGLTELSQIKKNVAKLKSELPQSIINAYKESESPRGNLVLVAEGEQF